MNSQESGKGKYQAGDWLARADYADRRAKRRRPSPREYRREGTLADWIGSARKAEVFASLRPEPESFDSLLDKLEVNNPAWMYVFERQHKPKIKKILLEAGNGAVRDLRFVHRGRFSR